MTVHGWPDALDRLNDNPPPLGLSRDDARGELVRRLPGMSGALLWTSALDQMSVIASVEAERVHVSIAHSNRYPTWEEIKAVRAWAFDEDTEVVMVLARKNEYINLHPNCFHLWQSKCGEEGR